MIITKSIAERRKAKNLSQVELASKVGILQSSLSLYENGKQSPSIETLVKIAKALDCTVDDLLKSA